MWCCAVPFIAALWLACYWGYWDDDQRDNRLFFWIIAFMTVVYVAAWVAFVINSTAP